MTAAHKNSYDKNSKMQIEGSVSSARINETQIASQGDLPPNVHDSQRLSSDAKLVP